MRSYLKIVLIQECVSDYTYIVFTDSVIKKWNTTENSHASGLYVNCRIFGASRNCRTLFFQADILVILF